LISTKHTKYIKDPQEDLMGKSGNPARRADELKISQVGDFKKRIGGVMRLPSGAVVKVRNPGGLRVFLNGGMIPNSLMTIVKRALDEGKGINENDILNAEGSIDPEMLTDMTALLDNVVVACVVTPQVLPIPENEDDRDDELLYADEFPDDDKMFLFQWLTGGTSDLEQFRLGQQQGVAALESVAESRKSAQ